MAAIRCSTPGWKSIGTFIRAKNAPTSPVSGSTDWLWPVERTIGAGDSKTTIVVSLSSAATVTSPPKLRYELNASTRSTTRIVPQLKAVSYTHLRAHETRHD